MCSASVALSRLAANGSAQIVRVAGGSVCPSIRASADALTPALIAGEAYVWCKIVRSDGVHTGEPDLHQRVQISDVSDVEFALTPWAASPTRSVTVQNLAFESLCMPWFPYRPPHR